MIPVIQYQISGQENIYQSLLRDTQQQRKNIERAILQAAIIVEADAKRRCPVDSGRLRSSITHKMTSEPTKIEAEVGTKVFYAPYIEFGTKPHGVSTKNPGLRLWMKRHGKDLIRKGLWVDPHKTGKRHFVPFEIAPSLRSWAEAHGVLEQKAFWVSGKAKPFLMPAFEKNRQRILSMLEVAHKQ